MIKYNKMLGLTIVQSITILLLIAVLTAIAIPTYYTYTRRNYFSQIVALAFPYRHAVENCYQNTSTLKDCNSGTNNIPPLLSSNNTSDLVKTLTVKQGKITIIPLAKNGITNKDTYILTPQIRRNKLFWTTTGESVENGYAN